VSLRQVSIQNESFLVKIRQLNALRESNEKLQQEIETVVNASSKDISPDLESSDDENSESLKNATTTADDASDEVGNNEVVFANGDQCLKHFSIC
jgi:hypothetical protein